MTGVQTCALPIYVPNKFAQDCSLIANCSDGSIRMNGLPKPDLGALGNDWETFCLKPGVNQVQCLYSSWAKKPTFKMKYREVFLIIYFADRAMNILGSASTGLPKGLMITDDKKTEEISEGVATFECNLDYDFVNSDEEQEVDVKKLAAVGNFILKQSADSSEVEVYTIIDSTIDPIQKDASIYAEDAGLDLLNEVVGKYAADKAYNIAYYINKFAYDSGFEIGINEVSNLTRKIGRAHV